MPGGADIWCDLDLAEIVHQRYPEIPRPPTPRPKICGACGREKTGDNAMVRASGRIECRVCHNARNRRWKEQRRNTP